MKYKMEGHVRVCTRKNLASFPEVTLLQMIDFLIWNTAGLEIKFNKNDATNKLYYPSESCYLLQLVRIQN